MTDTVNKPPKDRPPHPVGTASEEPRIELSIEDTAAEMRRGLAPRDGKLVAGGYNPYDVAPVFGGRNEAPPAPKTARKPSDLRKLSEWIKLQRRVRALKDGDADDTDGSGGSEKP